VVLFCSLKAFITDGWDEYGCALLSSPQLKICTPHSSLSLHRKAVNHSCLPSFHQNSVFTLPVSECFYLRHTTEFQNSQLLGTPMAGTHAVPPREGLTMLLPFARPVPRKQLPNHAAVQFMVTQSRKPAPRLTVLSHTPMPGNSAALRHHSFFLQPWGSSDHAVTPGILPHFTT